MSDTFRIFVNERPVEVAAGTDVLQAVEAFDPELARRLRAQQAYVTDGRGIELGGEVLLGPGAILRVVISARRQGRDDGDA